LDFTYFPYKMRRLLEKLRVPYTQQFAPEPTPLRKLLAIIRQNRGNAAKLKKAIASAFFKDSKSPDKMAGNTLISLKGHGIIGGDGDTTDFGNRLLALEDDATAHSELARHILTNMDGVPLVETLREMKRAGAKMSLGEVTAALRQRGFDASDNSSDLSGVLNWLRAAGVLNDYDVNEQRYAELVGASVQTIEALKGLNAAQVSFLRAMVALGVKDWMPYNEVVEHAETLYSGEVSYNWKDIDRTILQPLTKADFIQVQKKPKSTEGARGGKTAEVRPTEKFQKEIAEPILAPMYKAAGFSKVREIASIAFADIVAQVAQKVDQDARAKALEILAVRICQLLDLDFMGLRETDENVVAGGEVDAFMHAARLVYSRWQIQCKASDKITYEALAKEVGVAEVSLANVILVVSTGKLTEGAATFRKRIIGKTMLNIAIIDGEALDAIAKNPAAIGPILRAQAEEAMQIKPTPKSLFRGGGGSGGSGDTEVAKPAVRFAEAVPVEPIIEAKPYYSTSMGDMFCADAYDVLRFLIHKKVRVKLIVTSPPFALVRKKEYGNQDADMYVEWFMRFVPLFRRILQPEGGLVIDIGGSWIPGIPAKSTYHLKLLLRICESGFYLAQEFYHYNPARLPTPAEWVTVRRLRVKDAVNNVWWLVQDPFADADNRRVLREYSGAMKALLRNGYKAKMRPSGHDISTKFQNDRGGAIPPNVLEFANTESNSHYLTECRNRGMKPHPARFPIALPDFFIRFLTKPGELVLDPFAGSNVTGEAAERLGRRWLGVELNEEYVKGSALRFQKSESPAPALRAARANHRSRPARAASSMDLPFV
jgi:DNA modification methylase